jgi:MoaA/NifB/PqqE/SkfB family radical SAM enzyme
MHCSSCAQEDGAMPQMNARDIWALIENSDPSLKFVICLTGGEPLIHPRLLEWIHEGNKRTCEVGLFSSGIVGLDAARRPTPISIDGACRLRDAGVRFVYVSLHSMHAEVHDRIAGVPGSFRACLESLSHLRLASIDIRIHYVPMKPTIDELPKSLRFFAELGITELRYLRLVQHGRAATIWADIGINDYAQKDKVAEVLSFLQREPISLRFTVAGFPLLYDCRPIPSGSRCQAGKRLLYIDCGGAVYPCACVKNDPSSKLMEIAGGPKLGLVAIRDNSHGDHCLQDLRR